MGIIVALLAIFLLLFIDRKMGFEKERKKTVVNKETLIPLLMKYDWDYKFPLAIFGLETNWGKSCYNYNLFNITTGHSKRDYFTHPNIPLLFRSYNSFEESIQDFWRLLHIPRYSQAFAYRKNPELAIKYLILAGYSDTLDYNRYIKRLKEI